MGIRHTSAYRAGPETCVTGRGGDENPKQDARCFPCSVHPLLQIRQAASALEKRQALVEPSSVQPWLPALPTPSDAPGRALPCPAAAPQTALNNMGAAAAAWRGSWAGGRTAKAGPGERRPTFGARALGLISVRPENGCSEPRWHNVSPGTGTGHWEGW